MPAPAKIMTRMRHQLQALAYSSSLYRLVISGPVPKALLCAPSDPWPGDGARAKTLLEGAFAAGGQIFSASPPDWLNEEAAPAWIAYAHGFGWLRDLRAMGGDSARRLARGLLSSWLDRFEYWAPVVWEGPLIADRMTHLVGLHDFALASADGDFRTRVFESMVRQCRHLMRIVPEALAGILRVEESGEAMFGGALQGVALLRVLRGLVYAGVALPDGEKALALALSLLPVCLRTALYGDGAVRERDPCKQMTALQCLIDMRQALREARIALPPELPLMIEKVSAGLRFFRCGDGGLSLFNGGREESAVMIEALLQLSDARARAPKALGGYERIHAGRLVLICDSAPPPPMGLDGHAHAGLASFELCAGRERLIVNCGSHPTATTEGSWHEALSSTAAHSTITVAERNSSELLPGGGVGRRAGILSSARGTANGFAFVEVSHDGYRGTYGLNHSRRLSLSEDGDSLHGIDKLEGRGGVEYALRFHLHPHVQASLTQSGTAVLLRAGSGFYRFGAEGVPLALEESLYFGQDSPRRAAQIVLRAKTREGLNTLAWALVREKKA